MAAVAPQASTSTASLSPAADALKALTFQRLHPKTYLERFLAENVRPDGRDLDEWRDVSVNVGACPAGPALRPLCPPLPLHAHSLQAVLTPLRAAQARYPPRTGLRSSASARRPSCAA